MKYIYLLIVTITLLNCSCSNKGTNPDDELCTITDTTSHNVTWELDTVGHFSSSLYDVAAIDENNVWACGVIRTPEPDTVWHTDDTRNNAIKWNGTDYEYYQLEVIGYGGSVGIQDLRVVLAFNTSDIWFFSSVGSYVHLSNGQWESAFIWEQKGTPQAAWGAGPNDFYFVGNNGYITHYDGTGFSLIESGTTVDLYDIRGFADPKTGKQHIWVLGTRTILFYDGNKWEVVMDGENGLFPDGFGAPRALYVPNFYSVIISVWSGQYSRLYCVNQNDVNDLKLIGNHSFYSYGMAGFAMNNLFIATDFHTIEHFNGKTTIYYDELAGSGWFFGIDCINNKIYAVGTTGTFPTAIFLHGIQY